MDETLTQPTPPRPHKTKAVAVVTGIIALLIVIAWAVYEYADVLWPDDAYKSAWYLGSDNVLYELQNGVLAAVPGMPAGIIDAARANDTYALLVEEGNSVSVFRNEERIATAPAVRDVVLSSDGTQVAFARSGTSGAAPSAWEIIRVRNGMEERVASGFSPYFADDTHLIYFDEKGVWLKADGAAAIQLSGVAFSNVETSMTAQSPNRMGLSWMSDQVPLMMVFSLTSVEPLDFKAVPLARTVPSMPIAALTLSNTAAYALHEGSPTSLWVHTAKHPVGRELETLEGPAMITDIVFAP